MTAPRAITDDISDIVRRHDPDRFFTALFAPPARRDALLALYGFNHELARAREAVREPGLALIRLQWWREVVKGADKRHEVATPLTAALNAGQLDRGDLLAMIDAREIEAEPAIPDIATWRQYLLGTAGGLAVAGGRALGAANPETLRPFGAAYGVAGMLRSVPALAHQQRCLLPEDLLVARDLSPEGVVLRPDGPELTPIFAQLIEEGKNDAAVRQRAAGGHRGRLAGRAGATRFEAAGCWEIVAAGARHWRQVGGCFGGFYGAGLSEGSMGRRPCICFAATSRQGSSLERIP